MGLKWLSLGGCFNLCSLCLLWWGGGGGGGHGVAWRGGGEGGSEDAFLAFQSCQ